jgi:hypothetical protein
MTNYNDGKIHCCQNQTVVIPIDAKLHGQGNEVKYFGIYGKVLSQGVRMWNIKVLVHTTLKLWPRLKFSKSRSNSKGHKENSLDISIKALVLTIQKL